MTGTRVRHAEHGTGVVVGEGGPLLFVQFDRVGLQSVLATDVTPLPRVENALSEGMWSPALPTLLKAMALAIRSANDRWGVFTPAKVTLLPHQLWVAHRVLGSFPSRWLIADDVGLGKTIEAGLILSPLVSRQVVRRLLVVCPASLVTQWQQRLRTMFDLRFSIYAPDVDTPTADFWDLHSQVIVSMHTLRTDSRGRWARLLAADPWDLVLVDEAHHLSVDDGGERTLALELMQQLDRAGRIGSLLLFTGTPHRGKDAAFLALLELVDAQRFSTRRPLEDQLSLLPEVMIRNNKQNVTDMRGTALFQPTRVYDRPYSYSEAEASFYSEMSSFVELGLAYAGPARLQSQRRNKLVLVTLQKLAASSIAAVKRALSRRVAMLESLDDPDRGAKARLDKAWAELNALGSEDGPEAEDRRRRIEEKIDQLMDKVTLSPDEIPRLKRLVELAEQVGSETRIRVVRELVESLPEGTNVLLFTEYKATQALIVSELACRFGRDAVSFINGDGFLDDVVDSVGVAIRWNADRHAEAARFNRGVIRFLVSTEAAGEGIDLQDSCHTLVHVDLPWNPMRMHQRVGRLNRFGQKKPVSVYILRNPETVESRLWQLLHDKLDRVLQVHGRAMAEPEDVRELVLGASSGLEFERLVARAHLERPQKLDEWFDREAARFGGVDAVRMAETFTGQVARFDFGRDVPGLPQVDLIALSPFLRGALRFRGRPWDTHSGGAITFVTPPEWTKRRMGVRSRYVAVHFDRDRRTVAVAGERTAAAAEHLVGAGDRMLESALDDMIELVDVGAVVDGLANWLLVAEVRDTVTSSGSSTRNVVGLRGGLDGWECLQDWQLVVELGALLEQGDLRTKRSRPAKAAPSDALDVLRSGSAWLESHLSQLAVGMKLPQVSVVATLAPGTELTPREESLAL